MVTFKSFSMQNKLNLYTLFGLRLKLFRIIIDSIPLTLEPQSILALTPIQYLQYHKCIRTLLYTNLIENFIV